MVALACVTSERVLSLLERSIRTMQKKRRQKSKRFNQMQHALKMKSVPDSIKPNWIYYYVCFHVIFFYFFSTLVFIFRTNGESNLSFGLHIHIYIAVSNGKCICRSVCQFQNHNHNVYFSLFVLIISYICNANTLNKIWKREKKKPRWYWMGKGLLRIQHWVKKNRKSSDWISHVLNVRSSVFFLIKLFGRSEKEWTKQNVLPHLHTNTWENIVFRTIESS